MASINNPSESEKFQGPTVADYVEALKKIELLLEEVNKLKQSREYWFHKFLEMQEGYFTLKKLQLTVPAVGVN